ncbi:MAG: M24 family metallopeptidase [Bacillota bacterium]|uniref:M24 family metallopeptidase n=1 Tax=Thermanaerosceptrum fracticalcis TaxID=1712410 RepID=A0A7G6DYX8_THEFR|nr:Xaa-Pro peptidase family protein [Thermanaerosceptrum fracticalcis]QNB45032.1 M24 family metallopeptidase [Thermanaerosceptrum fracticalcis]
MDTSKRLAKLREYMEENGISLSIIMHPENQYYISGFKAIIYSRPIALMVEPAVTALIVPGLEEKHAEAEAAVDRLYIYYEHPEKTEDPKSYMEHLDKIISAFPKGTRIGVEASVMSMGLANHIKNAGYELLDIGRKISEMRFIKDEQEIELLIEAGKLVSLALSESLEKARAGISEIELDQYGNKALFEETAKKYPNASLDYFVMSPSGLIRSVMPHVFSNTRKLTENDIVIHSRQVGLNGYRAECERTFFVGEPTAKQKEVFNVAVAAQKAAMEIIKPGIMAKEVDMAARQIIQKAGYGEYSIHRTGHGIGLGVHEEPSLRFDSDLILQEGMAFSIEPGIYIPGIGGFRHSDTIIITKDGARVITDYPWELKDLIF